MRLTGNEGKPIQFEDAKKMTKKHRETFGEDATKSIYYSKDTINKIISTRGAAGMRMSDII